MFGALVPSNGQVHICFPSAQMSYFPCGTCTTELHTDRPCTNIPASPMKFLLYQAVKFGEDYDFSNKVKSNEGGEGLATTCHRPLWSVAR